MKKFGYSQITKVTITSGTKKLGNSAFGCMNGLKTVIYEEGITDLGIDAFLGCENIELPSTITKVVSERTGYAMAEKGYIKINLSSKEIKAKENSKEWFFPNGVEIRDEAGNEVKFSDDESES